MKASMLPNFGHKNFHNFNKTVCPMKLKFQIIIESLSAIKISQQPWEHP